MFGAKADTLIIEGDASGGFVPEFWGSVAASRYWHDQLVVQGNNGSRGLNPHTADRNTRYHVQEIQLFDRELTFDVDMSGVGCGCNAAAHLVAMPDTLVRPIQLTATSRVQGVSPCHEIDLIEGNTKALQSTLHTGCGPRCGWRHVQPGWLRWQQRGLKASASLRAGCYKGIDSTRPFTVRASFRGGLHGGAIYDVSLAR